VNLFATSRCGREFVLDASASPGPPGPPLRFGPNEVTACSQGIHPCISCQSVGGRAKPRLSAQFAGGTPRHRSAPGPVRASYILSGMPPESAPRHRSGRISSPVPAMTLARPARIIPFCQHFVPDHEPAPKTQPRPRWTARCPPPGLINDPGSGPPGDPLRAVNAEEAPAGPPGRAPRSTRALCRRGVGRAGNSPAARSPGCVVGEDLA